MYRLYFVVRIFQTTFEKKFFMFKSFYFILKFVFAIVYVQLYIFLIFRQDKIQEPIQKHYCIQDGQYKWVNYSSQNKRRSINVSVSGGEKS